jgi:lysyl-tRNA synthetase, class II
LRDALLIFLCNYGTVRKATLYFNQSMTKENSEKLTEFEERREKLQHLLERGIDAYPAQAERDHVISTVIDGFDMLEKEKTVITVCGRLRSKRTHGNLSFADVEDESGCVQIAISKKEIGETYKTFVKLIDVGDFVQITGTVFITQAGEKTIMASEWYVLTKALRGMPVEHFGLKDDDERYRKRYIDLLLNSDTRSIFQRRAHFWRVMRRFMEEKGFFEVETPTLEVTTGGAEARPFATYHNDFDLSVFLRISIGELWQKRLMASGFEKTFEIGRAFRNEGSSPNHLQEFTNMEFYWAYANYRDGMNLVKELYRYIAKEVYGRTKFNTRGLEFDLADEWIEIDYVAEIEKQTGVNVLTASEADMQLKLQELNVTYEGNNRERLTDSLWKHCRKNIGGPGFLINHPVFMAPLAKRKKDDPEKVEKFQVILGGAEVGNGYSELNDPVDQKERFMEQKKLIESGDEEAMMPDWEFVEMLEYGMPPTCGFGVGERLFAFLENKTLREVTLFPLMKPKNNDHGNGRDEKMQELGIDREKAQKLIDHHVADPVTKLHMRETEMIMCALAEHFGEDEEKWGIIGFLHDLDWDETKSTPEMHSLRTREILRENGATDFLIEIILSHNYGHAINDEFKNKKRETRIQHALAASETLTGLIVATTLILPSKKLEDLELSSLIKKFNNKKFAERCDRNIILECEKIGLSRDEFLEIGLRALQKHANVLGL